MFDEIEMDSDVSFTGDAFFDYVDVLTHRFEVVYLFALAPLQS